MLAAVDVGPGRTVVREASGGGRPAVMSVTAQPAATVAFPSVLAGASWWVDAERRTGTALDPVLVDLADGGNDLGQVAGDIGGPVVLAHTPGVDYLWSPGWDDMWIDTPAPAGLAAGDGLDVRFIVDPVALITGIPVDYHDNFLLHQGCDADSDVSWAVIYHQTTGEWEFWWSEDGTAVSKVTLQGTVGLKFARRAVTVDFATGVVSLFEQAVSAPRRWFDLPTAGSKWDLVDTVTAAGPVVLFDSTADIRHSATTAPDEIDGEIAIGFAGVLVAVQIRTGVDGDLVAGFDANDITIGPWSVVDGYPPLGGVGSTAASDGPFTGEAGETWTVHNFQTKSFPIVLVDRTCYVVGSRSYGETPVDDTVFDVAPGEHLTVAVAWRTSRAEVEGQALWSHKTSTLLHDQPGVDAFITSTVPGGVVAIASDGVDSALAEGPTVISGEPNLSVVTIDGTAGTITSWSDATPGAPTSTAPVDMSVTGVPMRVGALVDGTDPLYGSFELFSMAVFRRRLTPGEIAWLRTEMIG